MLPVRLYKNSSQPFEFHTGSCPPKKMLSIFLLAAVICSTAGKPFPDYQNDADNLAISSGAMGWDPLLPTVTDDQNSGARQLLSQPSSLSDSIFTNDMPGSTRTDMLDVGSATDLAILGEGAHVDVFGQTVSLDEGLSDEAVAGDLFGAPPDSVTDPPFSVGLAETDFVPDSCPFEADQAYGKRKRQSCAPPKTKISLDDKDAQLDDKPGPLPGFDQPGIPQTKLCFEAFIPLCCAGSEDLGLTQTECDECRLS
jgi:hypothetical protein